MIVFRVLFWQFLRPWTEANAQVVGIQKEHAMSESLKVVLIGAASPQWGYTISRDLLVMLSSGAVCRKYTPTLVLEDIDQVNLEINTRCARMVAKKLGGRVRVEATTDQKKALDGARFVVVSFAVGTLEAMQVDLDIPAEYGIFHPVGDTFSIGGAIRGARNIPALLSIARDIERYAHPEAWLLNLANPMSILCRAVTRETQVRTIGCCHELYGGIGFLAGKLPFAYDHWRTSLKLSVCGVNHCGWLKALRVKGRDGLPLLRKYLASRGITGESRRLYDSAAPDLAGANVKINLFLRHGVLPYSGDRHNVEFFSEFVNEGTNKGADFGVLLTTPQARLVQWRGDARAKMLARLAGKEPLDLRMSQEAAGKIIPALLLGTPFYDVGNLPYRGNELPGVPQGAVIERMVTYSKGSATPDPVTPLPRKVQEHLALITGIIEDFVEAAVTGDRALLIKALKRDPLLKNMKQAKIPEMVGRLLAAHKQYVHRGFFA